MLNAWLLLVPRADLLSGNLGRVVAGSTSSFVAAVENLN